MVLYFVRLPCTVGLILVLVVGFVHSLSAVDCAKLQHSIHVQMCGSASISHLLLCQTWYCIEFAYSDCSRQ